MPDDDILLERLKSMEDKLDTLSDTEKITELDIINLKNEIEKLKLGTNLYIPEDTEEKIIKLEKLSENADVFEKWKKTADEIKSIKQSLKNMDIPASYKDDIENIKQMIKNTEKDENKDDEIKKRIDSLEQYVRSIKPARIPAIPKDIDSHPEIINEVKEELDKALKDIDYLKKSRQIAAPGKDGKDIKITDSEVIDKLKNDIDSLKNEIESIKSTPQQKTVKTESGNDIEDIKMKAAALFSRMDKIEKNNEMLEDVLKKSAEREKEISNIRNDLKKIPKGITPEELNKPISALAGDINTLKKGISELKANKNKDKSLFLLQKKIDAVDKRIKDISFANRNDAKTFSKDYNMLKRAIKNFDTRISKIEKKPKDKNKVQKDSVKKDIDNIRKSLEAVKGDMNGLISKKEFEEFQAELIPPEIPDSKDVEEAMKKGIMLEKEIEKINKKSKEIDVFLKRKDELDKLKDGLKEIKDNISLMMKDNKKNFSDDNDYKKLAINISDNSKRIESIREKLNNLDKNNPKAPLPPPQKIPDKILSDIKNNSEGIEYLRKMHISKEAEHSKNFSLLSNKIDHNARTIENLMKELSLSLNSPENKDKSFRGVQKSDMESVYKQIEKIREEVKSKIDEKNAHEFENDVFREIENMHKNIKNVFDENKEYFRRFNTEISSFNDKIKKLETCAGSLENIDADRIHRDLEMVKSKQHWIENNIHEFNLEPLHEKIKELEKEIHNLRTNSPLIIE